MIVLAAKAIRSHCVPMVESYLAIASCLPEIFDDTWSLLGPAHNCIRRNAEGHFCAAEEQDMEQKHA